MVQLARYRHTDTKGTIESVHSNWVQCGEDVRPFFPLGQSKLSVKKKKIVCYTLFSVQKSLQAVLSCFQVILTTQQLAEGFNSAIHSH